MWHKGWKRWLGRITGRAEPIALHPPLAGDRDERSLEHVQFEAQTRHVGSVADLPSAGTAEPGRRA